MKTKRCLRNRDGAVSVLYVLLLVPILGLIALTVDYGYMLTVRVDLQRTADQAALAAVRDLISEPGEDQNLAKVRKTVREYVDYNINDDSFTVRDSDIEIGRYNPATVYSSIDILNNGYFDTVRVTLRRDELANTSVSLFFARVLGIDNADITASATAVLQKARYIYPGTAILPMAVSEQAWSHQHTDDEWSIYGSGKLKDENGRGIPGNWGTVDIGNENNSTSDLSAQIRQGIRQSDLDAMYNDQRISTNEYIDSQVHIEVNGDTGLSAGLKHAIQDVHGTTRLIPIYETMKGKGGNLEFEISGWGVVQVVDSSWNGSKNSRVTIRKAYLYDRELRPQRDLTNTTDIIENAYTVPVLVQ